MRPSRLLALGAATLALGGAATQASAQSVPFVGQFTITGAPYCPATSSSALWLGADGQTVPIATYPDLYKLIGTTYGGDGKTTFQLPNLMGRTPIHVGSGQSMGETLGADTTHLTLAQLPVHTHALLASSSETNTSTPAGNALGSFAAGRHVYAAGSSTTVAMSSSAVGSVGGGQAVDLHQPSLGLHICIVAKGQSPSQN